MPGAVGTLGSRIGVPSGITGVVRSRSANRGGVGVTGRDIGADCVIGGRSAEFAAITPQETIAAERAALIRTCLIRFCLYMTASRQTLFV